MNFNLKKHIGHLLFVSFLGMCLGCATETVNNYAVNNTAVSFDERKGVIENSNAAQAITEFQLDTSKSAIPEKVKKVLRSVRATGRAPNGYVGGRRFGNYENHLPKTDLNGQLINYR